MNINQIKHNLKTNVPVFKAGDTVRVKVKVVEGDNERLQAFDGVVVARKGSGIGETLPVPVARAKPPAACIAGLPASFLQTTRTT